MINIVLIGVAFVFGFVLGLSTGLHLHPEESEKDEFDSLWKDYHWEYKKEPKE